MNFFLTLFSTLVFVFVVLLIFLKFGVPVYRVERSNIICLLKLVMAGEATDNDWNVFIGVPIRHDPELDEIRCLCADITEREMLGERSPVIFSAKGYLELQEILDNLLAQAHDE